jgi:hypothetical protein
MKVSNVYTKWIYNLSVKYMIFIPIYIAIILCSTKKLEFIIDIELQNWPEATQVAVFALF